MIRVQRDIAPKILTALSQYPIVAITGPRQSGKTTLCKMIKPEFIYVNLEDLSLREFAKTDPKGFLKTYPKNIIIDEIQYVPELLSYLQVHIDETQLNGEFILTGSQNFLLLEQITQSLAGRVALFNLLPFSLAELKSGNFPFQDWEKYAVEGSYPRKWMNQIQNHDFYDNYLKTYVERDVRLIKNITNLDNFQKFIKLLAGRVGQLFNQSSLSTELGVDNKTVNSWLNLLEASYIAFRLQPYYNNFNKRLTKTPKVYFYDTGLLAYLLGIQNSDELDLHFAKGQIFENLVILERLKHSFNFKTHEKHYFWRDSSGLEVDLLIEQNQTFKAIEIKSGRTVQKEQFQSLLKFQKFAGNQQNFLIYAGTEKQERENLHVIGFDQINSI
ncbi:MAG: ATP-binding protein [Bacteroidia bacterium]|nr:ATP-binding protein [Bacteroidia bacterium]